MIISQEIVLIMIYSSLFFFFFGLVGLLMHSQSFKLDIGQVLAHNLYY